MFTPTLTSLLCISVLPGIFLLLFIYFLDRIEKEPLKLLFWVFFLGFVLIPPIAMFLENLLTQTAGVMLADFPLALIFFCNAVSPAVVEESLKYAVIRKYIWNHPEFNEHFDGVVYAVYVSMGFAIAENILYVFNLGMEVGIVRAVLSIPGHFLFAVTMGFFFAMAKFHPNRRWFYTPLSLLCPMVLHACYNGVVTCTDVENPPLPIDIISAWLVVILDCVLMWVLGIWCIRRMRRLSQNDPPALQQQAEQAFKNTQTTEEFNPAFRDPIAQSTTYNQTNRKQSGLFSWLAWIFLIGFTVVTLGSLFNVENIERLQFEALCRKYGPIETEIQNTWTQKYDQYEQKALTDEDWMQWLKTEYLPTWTELRKKLNELYRHSDELEYKRVKKLVTGRIDYANEFIRAVEEQSKQIAEKAVRLRIQTEYIDPILFSLENGILVNPSQLNEALHYAAVIGDQDLCALLLGKGANILVKNEDDKTIPEIAAEHGHTELAQFLNEKLLQKQQELKEREEREEAERLEDEAERLKEEEERLKEEAELEKQENAADDEGETDSDSENGPETATEEKADSAHENTAPLSLPWENQEEDE